MRHIAALWFFIMLIGPRVSFAQSYLGISGGGSISSEVVFRAAIPFEWSFGEHFSLQTEAVYLQRENRKLLLKLIGEEDYLQPTISYFGLPVLAKGKMNVGSFGLYALGGFKAGFGTSISTNSGSSPLRKERFKFEDLTIRRFDFGLNGGLGLEKHISNGRKIFVDYRIYLGLFDIDASSDSEIYNFGRTISLGFMMPLK
jgi:hypothetical protein